MTVPPPYTALLPDESANPTKEVMDFEEKHQLNEAENCRSHAEMRKNILKQITNFREGMMDASECQRLGGANHSTINTPAVERLKSQDGTAGLQKGLRILSHSQVDSDPTNMAASQGGARGEQIVRTGARSLAAMLNDSRHLMEQIHQLHAQLINLKDSLPLENSAAYSSCDNAVLRTAVRCANSRRVSSLSCSMRKHPWVKDALKLEGELQKKLGEGDPSADQVKQMEAQLKKLTSKLVRWRSAVSDELSTHIANFDDHLKKLSEHLVSGEELHHRLNTAAELDERELTLLQAQAMDFASGPDKGDGARAIYSQLQARIKVLEEEAVKIWSARIPEEDDLNVWKLKRLIDMFVPHIMGAMDFEVEGRADVVLKQVAEHKAHCEARWKREESEVSALLTAFVALQKKIRADEERASQTMRGLEEQKEKFIEERRELFFLLQEASSKSLHYHDELERMNADAELHFLENLQKRRLHEEEETTSDRSLTDSRVGTSKPSARKRSRTDE